MLGLEGQGGRQIYGRGFLRRTWRAGRGFPQRRISAGFFPPSLVVIERFGEGARKQRSSWYVRLAAIGVLGGVFPNGVTRQGFPPPV